MKKNTHLIITQICLLIPFIAFNSPRQTELLNFDWKFMKGDPGAAFTEWFDDAKWETVQLPHDAAISENLSNKESTSENGWLPYGKGWYRKYFNVPIEAKEKKVFISFDGVYRAAEVWFNGVYLGKQLNGYIGFQYDITREIKLGEKNVIAVKYDNTTKETSRWYTGEGIYRDVWLTITDMIYVPQYGTYITTPVIRKNLAVAKVETNVVNGYDRSKTCRLVTEIIAPDGKKVNEFTSVVPINAGENYLFRQEIEISLPMLWSFDAPNIYKAISKVYVDDNQLDEFETTFGIREINMTPDKGLLVNGKKVIAKGGDMHHDLGCLGSAALAKGYERKLTLLKKMGCNSIRLSHNPHAPVLLDVADRMGFLVFAEAYDKWTSQYYGGQESFDANWKKDLATFIKRDRNHPCVYIWSMGNETYNQMGLHDPKFETPADASDYGVDLYKRMVEYTHSLDPSRKVTVGLFPSREKFVKEWEHSNDYDYFTNSYPAEMAFYGDVVSWNYTENMFRSDHEKFPQLMFIASETGTNLNCAHRKLSWLEFDKEYVIGHYYWSATDYLGESVWPTKVWGRSFLDISDEMTSIGYYYKSFYDDLPMLHIMVYDESGARKEWFDKTENRRWDWYPMSDHWNWKSKMVKVGTFTNAEEVELFLNSKSLGIKKLADCDQGKMDWDVPYKPGELKAVARNKGVIVAEHVLKTAGKPTEIAFEPDVKTLKANGLDLAYIKVRLVDKNGLIVPDSDKLVNFSVEGDGFLAGTANGDIFCNEKWTGNIRTTYKGKCLVVLRSSQNKGEIVLKANAEGLPGKIFRIQAD